MAKLYEAQAKRFLRSAGIAVPLSVLAGSPEECGRAFREVGSRSAMVKAQVWETDRAAKGGVRSADTAEEAVAAGAEIQARFPDCQFLVEERVEIAREIYVGVTIDDRLRQPVLLLSSDGGSGIEQRERSVKRLVLGGGREPDEGSLAAFARSANVPEEVASIGVRLFRMARRIEARSLEINPLAQTVDGKFVALDCHASIDDYAIFRHPELGIEVAREFSGKPTELDLIAWNVERDDYRGTFYFAELPKKAGSELVGLHGCGGGGAMAAMDALQKEGLESADFSDTSGNPPASKVYRAAKIILSQPGLKGYFLCGSGVASQEQTHIARGLIKAFREDTLRIPAVLRLGGNLEDEAERLMSRYAGEAGAPIEVYKKFHTAEHCASRMRELIDADGSEKTLDSRQPKNVAGAPQYSFATRTGEITYNHEVCAKCESKACVAECVPQILQLRDGLPELAISREDAARGRCTECLACEVECWYQGAGGAAISLPIAGLVEYRERYADSR
jgi:succinyl-CoA synthetase beta subunit